MKVKSFFLMALIISGLFFGNKAQSQSIVNQSESYWTLVLEDESRISVDSYINYEYQESKDLDTLFAYGVQIQGNDIICHGFGYILKNENSFVIQEMKALPVFIRNTNSEEIVVEYHKYAFILASGEIRQAKEIHVQHDRITWLRVSYLSEDRDLLEIDNNLYVAERSNQRLVIEL